MLNYDANYIVNFCIINLVEPPSDRRHQIPHMKNEYLGENATMSWHAPLTAHCFISYITVFLSHPKLQGTSLPKEKKS